MGFNKGKNLYYYFTVQLLLIEKVFFSYPGLSIKKKTHTHKPHFVRSDTQSFRTKSSLPHAHKCMPKLKPLRTNGFISESVRTLHMVTNQDRIVYTNQKLRIRNNPRI